MRKADSGDKYPKISVAAYMQTLEHPFKDTIQRLRRVIKDIDPGITEEIKWNAPSFRLDRHFATFKLHPPRQLQIVLHRDTAAKNDDRQFTLDDPDGLVKWAASDRCVITLLSAEHAADMEPRILDLLRQWISQLRS